jgi:hypothetical protein
MDTTKNMQERDRKPRTSVCCEELSPAISCGEEEILSYLVRMLRGSDDDDDDRKKQKAESGRDKKDTG